MDTMEQIQWEKTKPHSGFQTANNALSYYLKQQNQIHKLRIPTNIFAINQGRYYIIEYDFKAEILFLYKKEFYLSGKNGYRESVNVDDLKKAITSGCQKIAWCYPDGAIYQITIEEFLNKSERRTTSNENKDVRTILLKDLPRWNP